MEMPSRIRRNSAGYRDPTDASRTATSEYGSTVGASCGRKKTTCFVLLILVAITTLYLLYAATGKILDETSVPAVHKVKQMVLQIRDTLSADVSNVQDIINDYEALLDDDNNSAVNATLVGAKVNVRKNLSALFPARSVQHLNDSIRLTKLTLQPYYYQIKEAVLELDKTKSFRLDTNGKLEVANGYKEDYFKILEKHPLKTLYLTVNRTVVRKMIDYKFFDYTSNNCERVEEKSVYGNGKGREMYNASCRPPGGTLRPRDLQPVALGAALPERFSQSEQSTTLGFIHIIQNAFVRSWGDIYINGLKIVPQRCSQDLSNKPPDNKSFSDANIYDEVLTIAQFWGSGFFHATVEQLTRLAPYIPFLQRNPHIKIHVDTRVSFILDIVRHVGLDPNRVISGHIKAKILYATASSGCARPSLFNTHLMSIWYRYYMRTQPEVRDSIIVIRRSPGKRRWFTHHDRIFKMVQKLGRERGLRVELFSDNPVPPFWKSLEMFSRALLVLGPHGAGLSNLFFSEPGTIVIEGLCYDGSRSNLCYRNLAQLLGMRWFGVILQEQCMNMRPEHLEGPLKFYLNRFAPVKKS